MTRLALAQLAVLVAACGSDPVSGTSAADRDGDGFAAMQDCDDRNPSVHPGARETVADGVDQDCDGADLLDGDGDGHDGVTAGGDDCDDERPGVAPGLPEVCNDGIDQDCDGADVPCEEDLDRDGWAPPADCDPLDPTVHPGATEVPWDGVDQDCDGVDPVDVDGDGHWAVPAGGDDCDDLAADVHPGVPDACGDGRDADCSGRDPVCPRPEEDRDGDGHGALAWGGDDCDDGDPAVHPGAVEVPVDGVDQDCDGVDWDAAAPIFPLPARGARESVVAGGPEGWLVAWTDRNAYAVPSNVFARYLDPDGHPVGEVLLLGTAEAIAPLAVAGDGTDFVVAWAEYHASGALLVVRRLPGDRSAPAPAVAFEHGAEVQALALAATRGRALVVADLAWRLVDLARGVAVAEGTFAAADHVAVAAEPDGFTLVRTVCETWERPGEDATFVRLDLDGHERISTLLPFTWVEQVASTGTGWMVLTFENPFETGGACFFRAGYQARFVRVDGAGEVLDELPAPEDGHSSRPAVAALGHAYLAAVPAGPIWCEPMCADWCACCPLGLELRTFADDAPLADGPWTPVVTGRAARLAAVDGRRALLGTGYAGLLVDPP